MLVWLPSESPFAGRRSKREHEACCFRIDPCLAAPRQHHSSAVNEPFTAEHLWPGLPTWCESPCAGQPFPKQLVVPQDDPLLAQPPYRARGVSRSNNSFAHDAHQELGQLVVDREPTGFRAGWLRYFPLSVLAQVLESRN